MWVYVFLGNLLRGLGETPIQPLGIAYLDDFASEDNAAFYIGNAYTEFNLGSGVPGLSHLLQIHDRNILALSSHASVNFKQSRHFSQHLLSEGKNTELNSCDL